MDTATTGQEWANKIREASHKWINGPTERDLQQIKAVELLLDGNVSASATAQKIADLHEPVLKAGDFGEGPLDGLWDLLAGAACNIDGMLAERLADLFIALHDLPDCCDSDGKRILIEGLVIWRDLPHWPWLFREWAIPIDILYHTMGTAETLHLRQEDADPAKARKLLNATTFAAYVLAKSPPGWLDQCGTMHSYAGIALDMALERSHKSEIDEVSKWHFLMLPAATWILLAGERLHELCHGDMPEANGGFVTYRQWPRRFCEWRWAFWKQRFRELEEPSGIADRYRGMVYKAVERMEQLEQA